MGKCGEVWVNDCILILGGVKESWLGRKGSLGVRVFFGREELEVWSRKIISDVGVNERNMVVKFKL